MSVKATFTDIAGKKSSAVGTIGCDGKPVTVWHGTAQCFVGVYDPRVCSADAQAICSRSDNGNLVAAVNQQACDAPCPPDAQESSHADEQAQASQVDRRLLSKRSLSGSSCFYKCNGGTGSKAVGGSVSTSPASVSAKINKSKNKYYSCGIVSKKKKKMQDCEASVTCEFS